MVGKIKSKKIKKYYFNTNIRIMGKNKQVKIMMKVGVNNIIIDIILSIFSKKIRYNSF